MNGANARSRNPRDGSVTGLTRGQKFKRYCGRWILAYLAVVVLVVIAAVVIIFPVLYVAFPRSAQDAINYADLIVVSQGILSPTPNSFYLEQITVFSTNSSQSASLAAWKGSLCLDPRCQYPFAEIEVPKAQAEDGMQIHISQPTEITNMTVFNKYTQIALGSEAYCVYLKGKGKLHKGAWPTMTVDYNKNLTMKGLQALTGFNLTSFNIIAPPLADGTNANGTVYIPNTSVTTYDMGNLTLNMSVDGTTIGTSFLQNILLRPGDNNFPMTAITNQTAVTGLILGPYKSGVIPVDIVGSAVENNGQHIPWYEQALGALPLRVDLNVLPALEESGLAGALVLSPP